MTNREQASAIIRKQALWASAAALLPLPLLDLAAVAVVQIDMLKQLSDLYGRNYDEMRGKAFVSALTGSTLATLGASLVKALPGVGTILGGISGMIIAGASTFAVGEVTADVFESGRNIEDIDPGDVKEAYKRAFSQGKKVVAEMRENPQTQAIFSDLERLHELREKGAITEAEYEAQKAKLLERL